MPGSHHGAVAASAPAMRSQSHRSSLRSGSRMAGTPARWHSACRKVAPSLPAAANSGQTVAIGSSSAMQPGVDQLQRQQRHERLPDGVEVDQRVVPPGRARRRVGPTADQVDHRHTVDHDAHRGADLPALAEVAHELLPHGAEAGVAVTADRDVHGPDSRPGAGPAASGGAGDGAETD